MLYLGQSTPPKTLADSYVMADLPESVPNTHQDGHDIPFKVYEDHERSMRNKIGARDEEEEEGRRPSE